MKPPTEIEALRAENDTLRSTVAAYRLTLEALRDRLGDAEAEVSSIGALAARALMDAPAVPTRQPVEEARA